MVGCVFPCDLGCCRLSWDRFGHDRAKNDPRSCISPVKALIAGCCMHALFLSSDCIGVVNEGLIRLIKLVCLGNHTDKARGLDFFSTTIE